MSLAPQSVSIVFWLLCLLSAALSFEDECEFYYLTQPIRKFTCNPYHQLNPRIRLQCIAYGVDNLAYEIQWFRLNQDGKSVITNARGVRIRMNSYQNILSSQLTIFNLNEHSAGIYRCQIVILQETGLGMRALEPSQQTLVEVPQEYDGLPPCPITHLHDARTACAEDIVPQSDPTIRSTFDNGTVLTPSLPQPTASASPVSCVLPNPSASPAMQQFHCDDSLFSHQASTGIPPWGYGLIVGGVTIAMLAISACLVVVVIRRRLQPKLRQSHNGPSIHHIQTDECTTNPLRRPLVCRPKPPIPLPQQGNLASHISITKQTGTKSQYANIERRLEEVGERLPRCTTNQINSDDHSEPACNQKPLTKVLPGGHVYHVINPEKKDTPSMYTAHDPSTASTSQGVLQLPVKPKQMQVDLAESGAYCNDMAYKALSPITKDYMNLYATTDNQKTILCDHDGQSC